MISQDESSPWRTLNIRLRSEDFFSEGDWELLGVTEKESHEEASVSGRRSPLLSTSAWLRRANLSLTRDAPAMFPALRNSQTRWRAVLPSCFSSLSVRKLSRGARVYSSGPCGMRVIVHPERKSLVFSFFLLFPSTLVSSPWPLRTSIPFLFSFSLYPQWSFRSRHHSLKRTQSQLEMERPTAFQSFSPLLQGDGACVR